MPECYKLCKIREILDLGGKPPKKWWIKSFIKEKQIFLVAKKDDKIIGFILGERTTGNIAILHLCVVKKEYRNKGVGQELLRKAEKECKKRKLKVIMIYGYKNKKIKHILKKLKYDIGNIYYEFQKWLYV